MIENLLYTRLSTYAGLIALVSTRIYPVKAPASTLKPFIVYYKISDVRNTSHSGFSNLSMTRFQISVYSETYIAAKNIRSQVIACMENWIDRPTIQAVLPAGENDIYEDDTKIFHLPLDFIIWHNQ